MGRMQAILHDISLNNHVISLSFTTTFHRASPWTQGRLRHTRARFEAYLCPYVGQQRSSSALVPARSLRAAHGWQLGPGRASRLASRRRDCRNPESIGVASDAAGPDHPRPPGASDRDHSRVAQSSWPRLWRMRCGAFIPDAESRLCEGGSPRPVLSGQGRVKEVVPGAAWPGRSRDCRRTCPGWPPPQSRRRP